MGCMGDRDASAADDTLWDASAADVVVLTCVVLTCCNVAVEHLMASHTHGIARSLRTR